MTVPPAINVPIAGVTLLAKKHYPQKTHFLTNLIRYVEEGGILETRYDVLEEIRQQLYVEEQQSLNLKRQKSSTSAVNLPLINIVLPASFH